MERDHDHILMLPNLAGDDELVQEVSAHPGREEIRADVTVQAPPCRTE